MCNRRALEVAVGVTELLPELLGSSTEGLAPLAAA